MYFEASNMALVPKLPDIAKSSLLLIEAEFKATNTNKNKNQLFPKVSEHVDQKIKYTSEIQL